MEILTTKEVAELLKVNKRTALKLISNGEIRGKKVGRGYRVLKKEIERFMSDGFDTKQEYNYKYESKTRPDASQEQEEATQETTQSTQEPEEAKGVNAKAREAVESLEVVDGQTTIDDHEYISTKEAAEIAGVSQRTIQNKLNEGGIKGKKEGRKWLAAKSSVLKYAESK